VDVQRALRPTEFARAAKRQELLTSVIDAIGHKYRVLIRLLHYDDTPFASLLTTNSDCSFVAAQIAANPSRILFIT
jgi:hypothetical protein